MKIIFVCTGNTCRSPMAESIAKSLMPEYEFYSRGLFAMDGQPAAVHTAEILNEKGLDAPTVSCQFSEQDTDADLILTMTEGHKQQLAMMFEKDLPVYTLYQYAGQNGEVSDPYGGTHAQYEQIYNELNYLLNEVKTRLEKDMDN
ncbi:low molecular weight protein arginine phosphatase [Staphylococcus simulans]|uniref:low molecular weight protein arginine phosphatase n=1 Tax=Staphylococcus simulans TaxID=1286 RepID=UPI001E454502|nr:low molecular weight protein arginine phosphatase [Staphylococcus simulans]MCD8916191.1 low molecular weight protein arginine phosphatase [Staphylococcus simulans]